MYRPHSQSPVLRSLRPGKDLADLTFWRRHSATVFKADLAGSNPGNVGKDVVAMRCIPRALNASKCVCGQGSVSLPAGGAYSAPQTPLAGWIWGVEGGKGKGRRKGKGRGGEEGKEWEGQPPRAKILATALIWCKW